MTVYENFQHLKGIVERDALAREELAACMKERNPLSSFCAAANRYGCELYPMDIVGEGEEYHAAMKRSTNGGGENSHKMAGWENYFETLVRDLKLEKQGKEL